MPTAEVNSARSWRATVTGRGGPCRDEDGRRDRRRRAFDDGGAIPKRVRPGKGRRWWHVQRRLVGRSGSSCRSCTKGLRRRTDSAGAHDAGRYDDRAADSAYFLAQHGPAGGCTGVPARPAGEDGPAPPLVLRPALERAMVARGHGPSSVPDSPRRSRCGHRRTGTPVMAQGACIIEQAGQADRVPGPGRFTCSARAWEHTMPGGPGRRPRWTCGRVRARRSRDGTRTVGRKRALGTGHRGYDADRAHLVDGVCRVPATSHIGRRHRRPSSVPAAPPSGRCRWAPRTGAPQVFRYRLACKAMACGGRRTGPIGRQRKIATSAPYV